MKNNPQKGTLKQMKLLSRSIAQTHQISRNLAHKIIETSPQDHSMVIALEGELGAGKTTFVKAFAKALGIKTHITSPTFVLLKGYRLQVTGYRFLYHIDAYRLKNYRDLLPLGVKEVMANPENIILIEWADLVKSILPKNYIKAHIDHINETTRKLEISSYVRKSS